MALTISEEDFLEHYGVKGMKWGVRRNRKLQSQASGTDKRTKKGKKVKSLASESQRIQNAGGGLKGTRKVRKEMIKSGELSKADARKGAARITRNIALATAGGAAAGYLITKSSGKSMSALKETQVDTHLHKAASLRKQLGNQKVPKPKKVVNPLTDAASSDLAKLRSQAAAAVKEANAMLRANDDKLGIPFPDRSYLKEWD